MLYIPTIRCTRKADATPSFLEYARPGAGTSWPEGKGSIAKNFQKIMGFLENLMLCKKIVGHFLLVKKKLFAGAMTPLTRRKQTSNYATAFGN